MFKPKDIGVGGIFFKAKKPSRFRKWYKDHLSFNLNPYGSSFEFRNANNLKRFSIFCGLFSKMIQINFRPQPNSLCQFSGRKHRKNGSVLAKN